MVNESILELPSLRNNLKLSDNLLRSKGKMSMGRKEDGGGKGASKNDYI